METVAKDFGIPERGMWTSDENRCRLIPKRTRCVTFQHLAIYLLGKQMPSEAMRKSLARVYRGRYQKMAESEYSLERRWKSHTKNSKSKVWLCKRIFRIFLETEEWRIESADDSADRDGKIIAEIIGMKWFPIEIMSTSICVVSRLISSNRQHLR